MGKVVTFYSYKGGTGRTMILANLAWLLASNGYRVLAIDWDLEAPGLHRYFRPFLVDPDMIETRGLIDIVWALASRTLAETGRGEEAVGARLYLESVDLEDHLEDYAVPIDWKFPGNGGIDFIGAGVQDATYSERVNTFNWKSFYQLGGKSFIDCVRDFVKDKYDFALIDSRTGVSDTSGICTMELPDAVVACLTLNRQSIEGVEAVLSSVKEWSRRSQIGETGQMLTSERSFRNPIETFPLITRIENSEKVKLDVGRRRARTILRTFLQSVPDNQLRAYWDDMEIAYRPYYAFEEILAAFGDTAGWAASSDTLLGEVEVIGKRIFQDSTLGMPEIPEADRGKVLRRYALGAEDHDISRAQDSSDQEAVRATYEKEHSWRASGCSYRLLLTDREIELLSDLGSNDLGKSMSFYLEQSKLLAPFIAVAGRIFTFATLLLLLFGLSFVPQINESLYRIFSGLNASISIPEVFAVLTVLFTIAVLILLYAVLRVSDSKTKPYGLTRRDALVLIVAWPVAAEIREARTTQTSAVLR